MSASEFRRLFKEMQESDDWPAIEASMEAENQRFVKLGKGDDSWERIVIELAQGTYNPTDAIEDWPPEKIRSMTDAVLRMRGDYSPPETRYSDRTWSRCFGCTDRTIRSWRKELSFPASEASLSEVQSWCDSTGKKLKAHP